MADATPIAEPAIVGFAASSRLSDWPEAEEALRQAHIYWLTTVRPDGRPHVVPLWGVWLDNACLFSTGDGSRKARNLAREPRCALSVEAGYLHLVVEGCAERLGDAAMLRRMVEEYSAKYDWPMRVRDGGIVDDQGNSGSVFVVRPSKVLAFRTGEDDFGATRWRFK